MLKVAVWNKSVPRVELDQRARDARLRLERTEQLLVPRVAVAAPWFRRILCLSALASRVTVREPAEFDGR